MRYLSILPILLFIFFSCNSTKETTSFTENQESYYIQRIKKNKNVYMIYVERNDSIFKVLSTKENKPVGDYIKLKKGRKYNFTIGKIFPLTMEGYFLAETSTIFEYDNTNIYPENGINVPLYVSDDLVGLYLKSDSIP